MAVSRPFGVGRVACQPQGQDGVEDAMASTVVWPRRQVYPLDRFAVCGRTSWSGDLGDATLAKDRFQPGTLVLIKSFMVSERNARQVEVALRKLGALRHPHLVDVVEMHAVPGFVHVVLECPTEGSLYGYVGGPGGKVEEALGRWFFQQTVTAVDFCHRQGQALGNIRLENVLLKKGAFLPIVKLWGVMCEGNGESDKLRSQESVLDYEAPELIEKDCNVDLLKCDVWALGAVLYRMLCGEYPFTPTSVQNPEICQLESYRENIVKFFSQGPDTYPVNLTPSCTDLIHRCLNLNAAERITIEEIFEHDWFKENFPEEARVMNEQILEEIERSQSPGSVGCPDLTVQNAIVDACYKHNGELTDSIIDNVMSEEQLLQKSTNTASNSTNTFLSHGF